jgi:hypothetical protein
VSNCKLWKTASRQWKKLADKEPFRKLERADIARYEKELAAYEQVTKILIILFAIMSLQLTSAGESQSIFSYYQKHGVCHALMYWIFVFLMHLIHKVQREGLIDN